jgi:NAD(P)-dependent dehydrogenase (short-subunit alcohol dehydrogenase family)
MSNGGRAIAVAADIAPEADKARMFEAARAAFGGEDAAFLNAGGVQPYGPFEDMSIQTFDKMVALNLRGPFLGLREALKALRPGGVCVVNASAAGWVGFADAAGYASAKHGAIGLVCSAARAIANKSLRVNAICPGNMATPLNGVAQNDAIVGPASLTPAPDCGALSPQMAAEVALFLMSPAAAGVNGQAQRVDAGLLSAFLPLEFFARHRER